MLRTCDRSPPTRAISTIVTFQRSTRSIERFHRFQLINRYRQTCKLAGSNIPESRSNSKQGRTRKFRSVAWRTNRDATMLQMILQGRDVSQPFLLARGKKGIVDITVFQFNSRFQIPSRLLISVGFNTCLYT